MHASKLGGFATLLLALTLGAHAAEKVTWKPIPDAVLRIDDRAPKQWSLFHAGKKYDPLVLQLGSRVLVIYVRNQAVYEIPPAQVEHKGEDLLWREIDKPAKPLATADWSTRHAEPMSRVARSGETHRRRPLGRHSDSANARFTGPLLTYGRAGKPHQRRNPLRRTRRRDHPFEHAL